MCIRDSVDYQYESPTQIVDGLTGFATDAEGIRIAQGLKREVNQLNASFTICLLYTSRCV